MGAKAFKQLLSSYFLWKRNYLYVATEMTLNSHVADLITTDKDLMLMEVEIKCSRSDLVCELRAIRKALKLDFTGNMSEGVTSKNLKHHNQIMVYNGFVIHFFICPNKFYFAVPDFLLSIAKEYLQGTPYGIILVKEGKDGFVKIEKRAKYLHKKGLDKETIKKLLRKVSIENHFLR